MFDIIGKRFRFFIISGLLILVGVIALAVFGLKSGIEFSSGSLLTLRFTEAVEIGELRQELVQLGYPNAVVQTTGKGAFQVRVTTLTTEQKAQLEQELENDFGPLEEVGFFSIEPTISRQTVRIAAIAIAIAAIGIMLYITWAFRRMPKPFRYGTCAIIALLYDIFIAVGIFALLAGILGWEVNLMFITGIMAVIGYSINDKIVNFDRIRENLLKGQNLDFEVAVNNSLVETLTRSLNTGLCTLFTILALMLFVGSTIMNFLVVLFVGIVIGTYSSIFIAPSLLVVWEKGEWGRFIRWLPFIKSGGR